MSYIAFLFERILEVELKKLGEEELSPSKIRNALNMMEYSELSCGNKHYKLFSKLNFLGVKILESLKIAPPKKAIPI